MDAAMAVFEMTKQFPVEERYGLTDQVRRSSRSVAANIAEAWRKRRYKAAFVAKLSDAEKVESHQVRFQNDVAPPRFSRGVKRLECGGVPPLCDGAA